MAINREVFICFYAILICLGVPGNVLILTGYSRKKIKNGTDIFIMGLAALDLFSSFFFIVKFRPWVRSNSFCQGQFFFTGWIAFAQMAVTLAICVDRFFAVCRPVHRRPRFRTAIAIIILCLLVTGVLYSPSLIATRYEPTIKDCIYRQDLEWFITYDRYVIQTFMVSTLFVTTLVYTRIVFALRHQNKIRTGLITNEPSQTKTDAEGNTVTSSGNPGQSGSGSVPTVPRQVGPTVTDGTNSLDKGPLGHPSSVSNVQPFASHEKPHPAPATVRTVSAAEPRTAVVAADETAVGRQMENRLTLMLGWVTAFYILSWIPAVIGRYVPLETRREFMSRSDLHHTVYAIFFRLYEINSAINFFIYWLLNRRFRKNCKEVFVQMKNFIS